MVGCNKYNTEEVFDMFLKKYSVPSQKSENNIIDKRLTSRRNLRYIEKKTIFKINRNLSKEFKA